MATRNLKCVGGPHDGEVHAVPGNHLRLVKSKPVSSQWRDDVEPDVSGTETFYTVRKFRTGPDSLLDDLFEFLAPHDMSDRDALRFQFAK